MKWLNTDSASYGLLVAAMSLNTRSTWKLCVNSAMIPHSSLAHTAGPVSEGRTLDNDEINI